MLMILSQGRVRIFDRVIVAQSKQQLLDNLIAGDDSAAQQRIVLADAQDGVPLVTPALKSQVCVQMNILENVPVDPWTGIPQVQQL